MEKIKQLNFDGYTVPESFLFYPSSRLSNLYEPEVLVARQKSFLIKPVNLILRCGELETRRHTNLSLRRRIIIGQKSFELKGAFIYDARSFFNENIAHLVQYHLSSIKLIIDYLGIPLSNLVILLGRTKTKLAEQFFSSLGVRFLSIDQPVTGNFVFTGVSDENFFPVIKNAKKFIDEESGLRSRELKSVTNEKRILILRRGTRVLLNEAEVGDFLKDRGFLCLYFEDLSLSEQMRFIRNAEYSISIHGAVLGYLPFVKSKNLKVIELFPPGFIVNPFRKLHSILFPEGKWCGIVGQFDWKVVKQLDHIQNIKKFSNQAFTLDIRSLEQSLDYMSTI